MKGHCQINRLLNQTKSVETLVSCQMGTCSDISRKFVRPSFIHDAIARSKEVAFQCTICSLTQG